jgi:hypothetical protein
VSARPWILPALIALAVIASRVPFAAGQLWAWDSVLYARALENGFHVDFELQGQRPQPPGYILYLAFASLFGALGADANGALVLVSIAASGLGAAAIFMLARRFVPAPAAGIATLAYACDPLVWLYGVVAYPYALLGALSVILASLFLHARTGGASWRMFASFAFGLVGGFRQDLYLLLAVLWVWLMWPASWRERAVCAGLAAAGGIVWLVPTAALSGGLGTYVAALARQSDHVRATFSVQAQGLAALWPNALFTVYALAWGLLAFAIVLAGVGAARALVYLRGERRVGPRARFFAAWLMPGVLFYVAVHIGEWGYVLSVLPGLYVLAALAIDAVAREVRGRPRVAWLGLAAAFALVPAFVFLASQERFSAQAVARHDAALVARVAYVKERFAAEDTILLAREDFLLVRHYLPAYDAWLYDPTPHVSEEGVRKKTTRATTIVIFTEGLVPRQRLDLRTAEVAPGVTLSYFTVAPGEVLEFYGERDIVREE